jgi:hypothetical protein
MGDSIKFTIGGQLGASYRGALNQAVTEAQSANTRLQRSLKLDLAKTNIALANAPARSAEASALFMQQQSLITRLNLLYAASAKQKASLNASEVAAVATAAAEKEAANRAALEKIIAEEREAGIALAAEQDAEVAAVAEAEAEKLAIRRKANLESMVLGRTGKSAAAQAYLDEAAAAMRAGFATQEMGSSAHGAEGAVVNLRRGMAELTVIVRELAAGRGFARVFSSGMLAAQWFGVAVTRILFSIPGLVAIAAIAIGYVLVKSWHAAKEAADDFKEHMSRANDVFRDGADALEKHHQAMLRNIAAAKEFNEWLTKLGKTEESATDVLDDRLKAMKEEYALRRQIAENHGATPQQLAKMDQDERKKELDAEQQTLNKLKADAAAAKQAAVDAHTKAEANRANLDDDKGKKDFDKTIEAVEYFNSRIPQEVKDKIAANDKTIADYKEKEANGVPLTIKDFLHMKYAQDENDKMYSTEYGKESLVGIGDGKAMVSPGEVQGIYQQALSKRALYLKQQEDLAKDQADLDAAEKDKKSTAEQHAAEVKRLTKKVGEDKAAIDLHDKYDSQLTASEKTRPLHLAATDWEKAGGAFGGHGVSMLDIGKQQLTELKGIHHEVKTNKKNSRGVNFGDH